MQHYFDVLKKYAVFTGRARRSEYWMFVLINAIIGIVLSLIMGATAGGALGGLFAAIYYLYAIALILPSLGVSVRRLHDTGKSGWWVLLILIPIIGAIILIVWFATDSTPGMNKYGPNPKEGAQAMAVA